MAVGILSCKAAVQGELADPLGHLVWYTVHNNLRVSPQDLEDRFNECGIDFGFCRIPSSPLTPSGGQRRT